MEDKLREEYSSNNIEIKNYEEEIKNLEKEINKTDLKVTLIIFLVSIMLSFLIVFLFKYTFFKILLLIVALIIIIILYIKKKKQDYTEDNYQLVNNEYLVIYQKQLEDKIKIERLKNRNLNIEEYIYNYLNDKKIKQDEIYYLMKKFTKEEKDLKEKIDIFRENKQKDNTIKEIIVNNEDKNVKKKENKNVLMKSTIKSLCVSSPLLIANSIIPAAPLVAATIFSSSFALNFLNEKRKINGKKKALANVYKNRINNNIQINSKTISKRKNIIKRTKVNRVTNRRKSVCRNLRINKKVPSRSKIIKTTSVLKVVTPITIMRVAPVIPIIPLALARSKRLTRKK